MSCYAPWLLVYRYRAKRCDEGRAMSKLKTQYVCSECAGVVTKWQGQCPHCNAWNTLIETALTVQAKGAAARFQGLAPSQAVVELGAVPSEQVDRLATGSEEFDRALGGGLVEGSVVLIGGDPGIGKSTLLLQSLAAMASQMPVLYVTGEESAAQVALRARRLALQADHLPLLAEIGLEQVLAVIEQRRPRVVVIDSIQTLYTSALQSAPGSVAQVRDCAAQLTRMSKTLGIAVVMIGHVTKEGTLAGPRVLEHMVDAVLYFEGDSQSSYRLVRAVKNRYGAVNELGVFAMTDRGLKGVNNPSALFLSKQAGLVPGACVLVTQEGSRPLLVEIQALVDSSFGGHPKRLSVGLESSRLAMLLAVLHRHAGMAAYDQDVFINAVGGVRIGEPAADLAVVMAIASSIKNRALPARLAVFGEVGLTGEIRPAPRGQERLREAAKLGFERVLCPKANAPRKALDGLEIIVVDRLEEALQQVF
jgi:DNA repair protein RadA/Sms